MSTFKGLMAEFPDIRVDYFRHDPSLPRSLAGFLSHVHSDHLDGLATIKSPYVYCSAATKQILVRLETRATRLAFANKLVEHRERTYRDLGNILRPIPLETPTKVELQPGNEIQVTLFDANHCTGAVMFLFQGSGGKAVLYTGDIRSEPWFVNNLTRNPFLIEYTCGLKTLDCIYLDTSNTHPMSFPTKAEGLRELITKVSKYPPDTVFHLSAWTFGYEEVWIHVDEYKYGLYKPLGGVPSLSAEGSALVGFVLGNTGQRGCLTRNEGVRLHSCERGISCAGITDKTVWIQPIVTRTPTGDEIAEMGIGGGGNDLVHGLEVELKDADVDRLLEDMPDDEVAHIKKMLSGGHGTLKLIVSLDNIAHDWKGEELSTKDITNQLKERMHERSIVFSEGSDQGQSQDLPKRITFPYSRHSSYPELCDLVKAFTPKDVFPCTVDETKWHEGTSIEKLFGKECSGTVFRHDQEMRLMVAQRAAELVIDEPSTQKTTSTEPSQVSRLINSSPNHRVTPSPREASTFTPGSASQALIRKAIADELGGDRIKRPRVNFDGRLSPSALGDARKAETLPNLLVDLTQETSHSYEQLSTVAETTTSQPIDNDSARTGEDVLSDYSDNEIETYYDPAEGVSRCQICGSEVYIISDVGEDDLHRAYCASCDRGILPFYEVLEPSQTFPGLAPREIDDQKEFDSDDMRQILDEYLDYASSAYDSQDSDGFEQTSYDQNSFIDDTIRSGPPEVDDSSSSDNENGYKERFENLQVQHLVLEQDHGELAQKHAALAGAHEELADAHEELRRDMLGSEYDRDQDGHDHDDEDYLLIDVPQPDPIVAELILVQAREDSSEGTGEMISPERLRDRARAFEDAVDDQRRQEISITSAGDNHTIAEIEL